MFELVLVVDDVVVVLLDEPLVEPVFVELPEFVFVELPVLVLVLPVVFAGAAAATAASMRVVTARLSFMVMIDYKISTAQKRTERIKILTRKRQMKVDEMREYS